MCNTKVSHNALQHDEGKINEGAGVHGAGTRGVK